jgi:hypothetical protein
MTDASIDLEVAALRCFVAASRNVFGVTAEESLQAQRDYNEALDAYVAALCGAKAV